jgi:hypothetical protein
MRSSGHPAAVDERPTAGGALKIVNRQHIHLLLSDDRTAAYTSKGLGSVAGTMADSEQLVLITLHLELSKQPTWGFRNPMFTRSITQSDTMPCIAGL